MNDLYRESLEDPGYDSCYHIPSRDGCIEQDVWMVPVEPVIRLTIERGEAFYVEGVGDLPPGKYLIVEGDDE